MKTSIALIIAALACSACASSQTGQQSTAPTSAAAQAEARPEPGTRHHDTPGGMKGHDTPGGMKGHEMPGGMKHHDMAASCPMAVAGASARAEDVQGGAAIAFTTTGDVTELRHRVAHMAEMHTLHHGEGRGAMMGGGSEMGSEMGMMGDGKMMPPAQARSEEIEGGARLVLTPNAPSDLAQLREHAEKMASGQCPMMSQREGAAAEPTAPDEPQAHGHAGGH